MTERERIDYIGDWCNLMAEQYHPEIDWGHKLCRYVWGIDIADWPETPTERDVEVARDWLNKLPESVAEKYKDFLFPATLDRRPKSER